jgi:hypothetical protein
LQLQFAMLFTWMEKEENEHLPFIIDCASINGWKPYYFYNYFIISTNFTSILPIIQHDDHTKSLIENPHFATYFKQLKLSFTTILELPSLVTYVVQPT